jgi:hypothetical protein
MRRITLLATAAVLSAVMLVGVASANESANNSAMHCGGPGLNPGQSWPGVSGGPAAGPNREQTPPEFAALAGADSVGALLQRDCYQVK